MLTLVWDVDDVLNGLMSEWLDKEWKVRHPECRVDYADVKENPPHGVLGVDKEDYLASLDVFRVSAMADAMPPNPRILDWFAEYGPRARHMVLTARPLQSAANVSAWVFRHFGNYVRTFAVVPSRSVPGEAAYDRTKGEYLQWLGRGDILIDDSEENIQGAEALGLRGLLYPQPWNRSRLSVDDLLLQLSKCVEGNSKCH